MTKLDQFLTQRKVIEFKLNRIGEYVNDFKTGSINQLKARLEILQDARKDFEQIQYEIEQHDKGTSVEEHYNSRAGFEDRFCDIIASINDIIDKTKISQISIEPVASSAGVSERPPESSFLQLNLPVLNLKKFDGTYKEWTNFVNSFKSVIDENKSLNKRQCFQYLKSCLHGEALRAVEALPINEENYKTAWDVLEKRFKNERLIVHDHILTILNSSAINKTYHSALRELVDIITSNVNSLINLKADTWNSLIVPIIVEKLDHNTKREWQMSLDTTVPTYQQLISFLEKRCTVLESLNAMSQTNKTYMTNTAAPKHNNNQIKFRTATHLSTQKKKSVCVFCKDAEHTITQCTSFLNLNTEERKSEAKKRNFCLNCLRDNHLIANCRSNTQCRTCNKRHHTLLHSNDSTNAEVVRIINNHSHTSKATSVLLSTALVLIKNNKEEYRPCRALLDQGSMSNFITTSASKRLGLKCVKTNVEIKGLNEAVSATHERATVELKSRINAFYTKLDCLVINKITENLPLATIIPDSLKVPTNIQLADPKFYESSEIDLLIGAETFWELLCIGQIKIPKGLVYQKTQLGFIAGGRYLERPVANFTACNVSATKQNFRLEEQVKNFFELEEVSNNNSKTLSVEEIECENHFQKNTSRDGNGRFIVKLPFKNKEVNIGDTKRLALGRFNNLERNLSKNVEKKRVYVNFMHEYRELGHMEPLVEEIETNNCAYLSHHAVINENSTTSRLRVVFDASLKSSNLLSLNDNLMAGPVIQEDLFSIILRFRSFQYVLNADIAKMYRQILIDQQDTNYQLIFWREDSGKKLETYRLKTLTYGTKPASYIATRCLKELSQQNETNNPIVSKIIARDFYMDDLLTGANDTKDLLDIQDGVIKILKQGQFELRKFRSNYPGISAENSIEHRENIDLSKSESFTKILGLLWNPETDVFKYEITLNSIPKKVTKRIILSLTAQIFDPLGLLGPVVMKAKHILQRLWALKLSWDESVPTQIYTEWITFVNELSQLQDLKIPRKTITFFPYLLIELHGFCDASQVGYAAVIYLRVSKDNNRFQTSLLCAKSRVAPLKTITLPRLELCGALLLARLMNRARSSLQLKDVRIYLWADSTIVLSWLKSSPGSLKSFVANRVTEINSLTREADWRHVRTENNPADILSRGACPGAFLRNDTWFSGPQFLEKDKSSWPQLINTSQLELPEKRVIMTNTYNDNSDVHILYKFSRFQKIQRVIAWILRFKYNANKDKDHKRTGNLSCEELHESTLTIARLVQKDTFALELKNLNESKPLHKKSKLLCLNPFVDEVGLIRVGGRIKNAKISVDIKHPIILPKHHTITTILIRKFHEDHLHAGPQATLAAIRQQFWILSGKGITRQVLQRCIKCFKTNPKRVNPLMGDLPAARVQPTRAFLKTGIDYAGPMLIREFRGRGKRLIKAYVALFVCFTTKAVHIELVPDLSTNEFLGALKRFIGRRGRPTDIYSNNATNFVGANNELKQLIDFFKKNEFSLIEEELAEMGIRWHFIPPKSPHMGGLWEVNIKSVKGHLKRTMGNANLTFSELNTLLK